MKRRPHRSIVGSWLGTALALVAGPLCALELGGARLISAAGAPLDIEIALQDVQDGELDDLKPEQLRGLSVEELKAFLQEQLRNAYDIKEGQIEQQRPGLMREAERFFILQQIDTLWREHLQAMDALRESVGLRGYGQKDPLIEYKNEGYDMFLEMMTQMRRNVIYSMFMFQPAPATPVAQA